MHCTAPGVSEFRPQIIFPEALVLTVSYLLCSPSAQLGIMAEHVLQWKRILSSMASVPHAMMRVDDEFLPCSWLTRVAPCSSPRSPSGTG